MLRRTIVAVCWGCAVVLAGPVAVLSRPATYTVRSGDSVWEIAQRFRMDAASLVRLNHLADPDSLQPGEILRLAPADGAGRRSARWDAARHARPRRARIRPAHRGRAARENPLARLAVAQALFAAVHTGVAAPTPPGTPSFAFAEHLVALEVRLTNTALRYLGVPYAWGGESFNGVDCSGFVQAVFRRNGILLPRTADAQFAVGRYVPVDALRPGDLVFFETYAPGASHVGIYLGDGRFVHASVSQGVRIDSLSDGYYAARYIGARRETGT